MLAAQPILATSCVTGVAGGAHGERSRRSKGDFKGAFAAIDPILIWSPPHGGAARGFTQENAVFVAECKGERMLIRVDAVLPAAVQFADPSVTIHFDADPERRDAIPQKISGCGQGACVRRLCSQRLRKEPVLSGAEFLA